MKPIEFTEQTTVAAKNQPQYTPLPCFIEQGGDGQVIFCISLSFYERVILFFTGKLWVSLMMFGKDITPSRFSVNKGDMLITKKNENK